jgi:hypothetical protein
MEILDLFEESSGQPAKNPVADLFPGESRSYRLIPRNGTDTVVEVQCFENRLPATSMPPTPPMATARSLGGDSAAGGPAASGPAASGPVGDLLGAIVILRDLTSRRQMEDSLVQSQRMEAVANMAGGLSHDFNNQLTIILGYADEFCERLAGEDKEAALEIKRAASMASSITGQLLMLSRRGEARFEVLNVNEVVCELQPMISHSLGKIRTLVTDLGSPEGFVRSDRNQLKRVLLNLVLNARDAMPTSGELRIESATVDIEPDSQQARHAGPHLRAVLLYQEGRIRHRTGPVHRAQHHRTEPRLYTRRERDRPRHQLRDSAPLRRHVPEDRRRRRSGSRRQRRAYSHHPSGGG